MAFKDFLLSFFPHRSIDPDHPNNIRFFGKLSNVFNYIEKLVIQVKKESDISTATYSISAREEEAGIVSDTSLSIELRRANILAHKRKSDGSITKEELINALRAFGIEVSITNVSTQHLMKLNILKPYGVPDNLEHIQAFVEEVCRAHVGKEWTFNSISWNEFDSYDMTWDEFESLNLTWNEFEIYER
ncbi:hypothetical protein DUF2313 [Gottschalkia acidurici 9a]|uniref:EF-hand domain-containing protein n=1 Tax=Gottschalkia acidurici (strain ATCC 7906 / DSM 604 / BCRC 14475 / CIP 104303 / KCTC 5404 / NCIMB 10678 / 9a) TaxID=1128398 RepID=K0AZ25_GOTA9|nr:putative phage tail protein [Gottschalkia acidurici]AFS78514.1 hypothetical protein DUF2313 [Gottschalkia acidurici 9a]